MKINALPSRVLLAGFALALEGFSLLTACSGCATFGEPPPRIAIRAINSNQFLVDDQEVDCDGLARAVRRTGARAETEIQVQLAPGLSPVTLRPAYAALQQAGYFKVLFVAQREATATVADRPSTATPSTSLSPTGKKSPKKLK